MAGHSKWANIKHRKARQDAKKGKVFTKLIRELTIAAKLGGGEPDDNPRLRAAIDKALIANMTRDTIDRAVSRGAGTNEADNVEELTYEGYAPGGVAILVECMTDNRNRTVAEVRHAFNKRGGNLGTDGSVNYLFARKGQIIFEAGANEDQVMEVALDAGADDVVAHEDGSIEVLTPWETVSKVKDVMAKAGLKSDNADVAMIAAVLVPLDKEAAEALLDMVDALEDLDDVQNVYTNADISAEVMEQLNA